MLKLLEFVVIEKNFSKGINIGICAINDQIRNVMHNKDATKAY